MFVGDIFHRYDGMAMPTRTLDLTTLEISRLYEQTLGGEYLRWVRDYRERTGDTTYHAEMIGGDASAPAGVIAGPGESHVIEACGVGFDGRDPGDVFDEAEAVYRAAGSAYGYMQISPYVDAAYGPALRARGFAFDHTLHVFCAALASLEIEDCRGASGITIERVDHDDAERVERAAIEVVRGKLGLDDDAQVDEAKAVISRMVVSCRGVATFVARRGDAIAGGASIGLWEGHPLSPSHANMYGAGVEPAWRGRGVQMALIRARLRWARERGVETVSLDCRPGVATERNAARLGFELVYTKPVFLKRYTSADAAG